MLEIRGDGPTRTGARRGRRGGESPRHGGGRRVQVPDWPGGKLGVGRAVGKGILRVLREYEQGHSYQSQVELVSGEIGEDVAYYLSQSEQGGSAVLLGVLGKPSGVVAAGGMMVEVLPGAPGGDDRPPRREHRRHPRRQPPDRGGGRRARRREGPRRARPRSEGGPPPALPLPLQPRAPAGPPRPALGRGPRLPARATTAPSRPTAPSAAPATVSPRKSWPDRCGFIGTMNNPPTPCAPSTSPRRSTTSTICPTSGTSTRRPSPTPWRATAGWPGEDVRFLTGTDEHGQNIERAARAEGIAPLALADRVVATLPRAARPAGVLQRRLHPHDRGAAPAGRRGDHPPHRGGRRLLHGDARGVVLLALRDLLHREGAGGRARRCPVHGTPGRVEVGGERLLPPLEVPAAAARPLRRAPGVRAARRAG